MHLTPNELIYKKGENAKFVYFVSSGRVNLCYGSPEIAFKSFIAGSYYGEIEILENIPRICSLRSMG